jgi:hypothetical protein
MLPVILFALPCLTVTGAEAWSVHSDAEILARTRRGCASAVESTLPDQPLESWFHNVFGKGGKFYWAIAGGCLEKPGSEEPSEFPLCVTMDWSVRRAGTRVSVRALFLVGSARGGGRDQLLKTPQLLWLLAMSSSPAEDLKFEDVNTLAQLPTTLAALR